MLKNRKRHKATRTQLVLNWAVHSQNCLLYSCPPPEPFDPICIRTLPFLECNLGNGNADCQRGQTCCRVGPCGGTSCLPRRPPTTATTAKPPPGEWVGFTVSFSVFWQNTSLSLPLSPQLILRLLKKTACALYDLIAILYIYLTFKSFLLQQFALSLPV